jgi:hypothetical protein
MKTESPNNHPPEPQSKIQTTIQTQQEVCHIAALSFTLKKSIKAEERIMETQIFHHAKNI